LLDAIREMLGGLTVTYEMHDGTDRLEPRAWRALVECALARSRAPAKAW
jgi:hypothetical protein